MGYKEKVAIMAQKAYENDLKNNYDDGFSELDAVSSMLDGITNYHNYVINMEKQMEFQKFRCSDQQEWVEWLSDANDHRILKHEHMIDCVAQLNRFCARNDLQLFYEGPFDDELRYKDSDTRFSIAAMADEYCSEMFMAGQNEIVNEKHLVYMKSKVSESENLKNNEVSRKLPVKHNENSLERGNEFGFSEGESVQGIELK